MTGSGAEPGSLLGGLTVGEFLDRYWQKRPYLIRGAIPGFVPPVTPEELAGLACVDEAESRLVVTRDGSPEMRHGPFTDEDFAALPEKRWTLLVQEVEQFVSGVAELQSRFRFVPNWRMDDVMVSYASDEGGVGAHVDNYDVFLLQGSGRRRWRIDDRPLAADVDPPEMLPDGFRPTDEWVLEPGDMLYLPPRIPHEGVALGNCMTLSVGCRAPTEVEILTGFLGFTSEAMDHDARYRDPDLTVSEDPGRIAPSVLEKIGDIVASAVEDPRAVGRWFGCAVTEPKRRFEPFEPEQRYTEDQLRATLLEGATLERSAVSHFAYVPWDDGTASLFVGGREHPLRDRDLARRICGSDRLDAGSLETGLEAPGVVTLLAELVHSGFLVVETKEG